MRRLGAYKTHVAHLRSASSFRRDRGFESVSLQQRESRANLKTTSRLRFLGKSLYRIIGTVIGAGVALLFVAFFAQERVLFLGALALWVGLCTFGSQYARNFAAYSFVLSGYTVAIPNSPKGGGYSHRIRAAGHHPPASLGGDLPGLSKRGGDKRSCVRQVQQIGHG